MLILFNPYRNCMWWALGKYEMGRVQETYRTEVLNEIYGWEVVSPGFGEGLEEHPAPRVFDGTIKLLR